MSFLNPLALVGLLLVSLPVMIHLLTRRRARRLDFPTLRYLRETPSFRLHPRRIQEPLLLALRVLAVVGLVLGLARPLVLLWRPQPTRLILLDASLSMRARGRAAAAREAARAIINQLRPDERAALIAVSSTATVLAATTTDRQALLAAVERYEPGSDRVDFRSSLSRVGALLEREAPGPAEVDLISDFQQANLSSLNLTQAQLPAHVRPHAVGATLERNAFMLDEAAWKSASGVEFSATEIVSEGDERSGARRTWTIDASVGERPGLTWRTEVNGQLTGRTRALAPDDFDADDERFFAFKPPREARVLLVESDDETSRYMGAALEAAASSLSSTERLLVRQRQLPTRAPELEPYALVVLTLHGALRAEELDLLTEYAKAGGDVWLSLARDADASGLNELAASNVGRQLPFQSIRRMSGQASFSPAAADLAAPPLHSMTENAFRSLRAVSVREGYAFEPRAGADILMRWSDGTAGFISAPLGSGNLMLLGTSTESAASNLGNSPAFPVLAFSLLRAAAAPDESLSFNLGEAVELGLSPQAAVTITDADGHRTEARGRDLLQRPGSIFREAGIYRVDTERGVRFVALNTPALESERALARSEEVEHYFSAPERVSTSPGREWRDAAERDRQAWRYFLAGALLLLLAELLGDVRRRVEAHQGTSESVGRDERGGSNGRATGAASQE